MDKRIIPFRIIYSDHASNLKISEVLKQHQHLPPREFADAHRVVTCYVAGRSQFVQIEICSVLMKFPSSCVLPGTGLGWWGWEKKRFFSQHVPRHMMK